MIINNSPQNQAVLSNVGQIGEFRIRNSAKAFNILSSGLYANKIRAIVRELSCNAVDSHVAAGKPDLPFDVHLPNTLEPWFSIRDYGTGLSHDQVTNIYTTYFESTKTDSNDFIGALGLGSKSPFSYTDNFTVTAIKDGRKGIYTAFINEHGVPSIALMTESDSTEPNGVEVKFSVNDRWDFEKFVSEAKNVYKYFKLRPVIHGCKSFEFPEIQYKDKNIIYGVHTVESSRSIAIMGNISYPIEVPNADTNLGELRHMLDCGLLMEFDIGELDFQASREGLSYIPSTVDAIKRRLEQLNQQLARFIAMEADKITNFWDRADYLETRKRETLWSNAVTKYVADTNFPLVLVTGNHYNFLKPFNFKVEDLAKKYNIAIRGFTKQRHSDKCQNLKPESTMDDVTKTHVLNWKIYPSKNVHLVVTDTKRGALERAKFHWRQNKQTNSDKYVIVLERADKTRTCRFTQFLKDLHNPPRVQYASQLLEKDRASGNNWGRASILRLEEKQRSRHTNTLSWTNAGAAGDMDSNKTYYYIELKAWDAVGLPMSDIKNFYRCVRQAGIFSDDIYGVRKADIEAIQTQKNWVELSGFVREKLKTVDLGNVMGLVKQSIDFNALFKYNSDKINQDSPYSKLYNEFKGVGDFDTNKRHNLEQLFRAYGIPINNSVDHTALTAKYKAEVDKMYKRYPLLKSLSYYVDKAAVAEYINVIDQTKGN